MIYINEITGTVIKIIEAKEETEDTQGMLNYDCFRKEVLFLLLSILKNDCNLFITHKKYLSNKKC